MWLWWLGSNWSNVSMGSMQYCNIDQYYACTYTCTRGRVCCVLLWNSNLLHYVENNVLWDGHPRKGKKRRGIRECNKTSPFPGFIPLRIGSIAIACYRYRYEFMILELGVSCALWCWLQRSCGDNTLPSSQTRQTPNHHNIAFLTYVHVYSCSTETLVLSRPPFSLSLSSCAALLFVSPFCFFAFW